MCWFMRIQTHLILIYLRMYGKNLVLGFTCTLTFVQLLATSGKHPCTYFSEAMGTPVWACSFLSSNQIQSKDIKFKLKWHLYNICSGSIWNRTASVALLFQAFDYAELKGKRQRNLKPFYSAWLNLTLPPRLHVTRARRYQGRSCECWGLSWISNFETWKIYWEYIQYSYIHLL